MTFEDDFTARLPDAGGAARVGVSSLPLRGRDEQGRAVGLDLGLVERATQIRPRAGRVELAVDRRSGRARVGGHGLALAPVAADTESAPSVEEDAVTWANAWTDTDFMWRAHPLGASTFMHVRSSAAPEGFALDVDVPDGARLVPATPDLPVRVLRGSDVLAEISPPQAWDAEQTPVPVSMAVRGARLELTVPHREADVLYPLLVDPSVMERYQWSDQHGDDFYGGWEFTGAGDSRWSGFTGQGPQGYGLYNRRDVGHGTQEYSHGDSASWKLRSPGRSWLSFVQFWHVRHDSPNLTTCLSTGLRLHNNGWAHVDPGCRYMNDVYSSAEDRYGPDSPLYQSTLRGGSADIELAMRGTGPRSTFLGYVGGFTAIYNDSELPQVSFTQLPKWTNDPNEKIKVRGIDPGLGIRYLRLRRKDGQNWNGAGEVNEPCPRKRCPLSSGNITTPLTLETTVGNLPEGENILQVEGEDVMGSTHRVRSDQTITVDTTAPAVSLRGSLWDARDGSPLPPGFYDIGLDVSDALTGISFIQFKMDGNLVHNIEGPSECQGSECTVPIESWAVDGTNLTGSHTFEVRVRDFADNEHVETWTASFADPAAAVDPDQLCRDAFAGFPDGYREFCLHEDNPEARTAQYVGLNGEERRLCAKLGLAICFAYFNDSRNALWNRAHLFTPTSGTDNSKANAFQHAFWVAQMINSAGSDADAEEFAVAHEGRRHTQRSDTGSRRSSRMDILNNRVAGSYGKANRVDDLSLCFGILAKVFVGEKIPVDDDPYTWYDHFGTGQLIWRVLHSDRGDLVERTGSGCT